MFRKSVLLVLTSTAAVGLALGDASARGGIHGVAGVRAANSSYVARTNLPVVRHSVPVVRNNLPLDPKFSEHYRAPIKNIRYLPNKITRPYVNPNAAVQIKPNYGSTLKPIPINPVIAATASRGSRVDLPASPTHPASPMPSPHMPGAHGTPVITPGSDIASVATFEEAPAAMAAAPRVVTATAAASTYPAAANPGPCSCLSKQYTAQGAVVFMDRCTNEVAVTAPQQIGALVPNQTLPATK